MTGMDAELRANIEVVQSFTVASPHLDLDRCLFSGQVFRWWKTGDHSYEGVDGRNWFRVTQGESDTEIESNASLQTYRNLFNLEVRTSWIGQMIVSRAPEMAPYIAALRGLRVMKPSDPTEVFFSFLCTANNHIKRITPMVAKLAEYGEAIGATGYKRFPRSDVVAAIPEAELRIKGFGYRGATIPHAAQEVVKRGGDEWLESLKSVGYGQAHMELVAIKGIGNKLADCICLYGLHYSEAVPIDTHLWQAACRVFFPEHTGKALTELRYRQVGDFFRERFGTTAGWAHLYLYYENQLNWRTR
jgi:N-glycosylase/DNA lyase